MRVLTYRQAPELHSNIPPSTAVLLEVPLGQHNYVAVHDNTRVYQPWEKPFYVLSAGDVYNMKTRRIEKFGDGTSPNSNRSPANVTNK